MTDLDWALAEEQLLLLNIKWIHLLKHTWSIA